MENKSEFTAKEIIELEKKCREAYEPIISWHDWVNSDNKFFKEILRKTQ